MILLRYYGLGDKQVEYQIIDRSSFKKFLGLESGDKVPDEKTVWLFRENLTKAGVIELLLISNLLLPLTISYRKCPEIILLEKVSLYGK